MFKGSGAKYIYHHFSSITCCFNFLNLNAFISPTASVPQFTFPKRKIIPPLFWPPFPFHHTQKKTPVQYVCFVPLKGSSPFFNNRLQTTIPPGFLVWIPKRKGTRPHSILQSFGTFFKKWTNKNETKQNESFKLSPPLRETPPKPLKSPHKLEKTLTFPTFGKKTPAFFAIIRLTQKSAILPSQAPAEAAFFGSCYRGYVEKQTSLTAFTGQVCAYLEVRFPLGWW